MHGLQSGPPLMSAVLFTALLALALVGVPLFVFLGGAALLGVVIAQLDPAVLIVEIGRLASSPNLLVIPLFTLAGAVLAASEAPSRMVRLFDAALGWLPGGVAIVALSACAFFTAFSGASGITILALGGIFYPVLRQARYGERFSLGLITASGSLGLLFPPSLAVLLYGIVANVAIEDMFKAGVLPGLILLLMLALYSAFRGLRCEGRAGATPFNLRRLGRAAREAIWEIVLPFGVGLGIFGGFVTLTEAAAWTAAYVLFVEFVVHRSLRLDRRLLNVLREAVILVGSIVIILAMALGLSNLMVDSQLPTRLLGWSENVVSSPLQFLILLNIFLLMVGAVMDIFSAMMVIVPLILPLATRFGVDPVHLGIIFLANLEIGYCTPPVGINLFISSQRLKKPVLTCFRATLPFLVIMLVWLMLLTYVPALSLWWRAGN